MISLQQKMQVFAPKNFKNLLIKETKDNRKESLDNSQLLLSMEESENNDPEYDPIIKKFRKQNLKRCMLKMNK